MTNPACKLAVIGAGPAGLALALIAAEQLPEAHISVFDARPSDQDVSHDPRTLALSLGSIQTLQRMGIWSAMDLPRVCPISEVHVSQQQPSLFCRTGHEPVVRIRAQEQGTDQLGAVVSYGQLVAPMQEAWTAKVAAHPERFASHFSCKVSAVKWRPDGVEVDAKVAQCFDLAVIAEGGVFAEQAPLRWPAGLSHDYLQTAWVGTATLDKTATSRRTAYERFTPHGPAALLPLPALDTDKRERAALVWCVPRAADPVEHLSEPGRLHLLNSIFHQDVGRILALSELKSFALGLNAARTLVAAPETGGSTPRIVRIGNAAQTLHPVAGQGFNLGLRDVEVLVQSLSRHRELSRALRQLEWTRAPDRWALIGMTDFLARSFTVSPPWLASLRGAGLGLLQALGPVKSQLANTMMFGLRG